MPKMTEEPLVAIQLRLYATDLEFLQDLYRDNIGVNKVIRTLIRTYVRQIQAASGAKIDAQENAQAPLEVPNDLFNSIIGAAP